MSATSSTTKHTNGSPQALLFVHIPKCAGVSVLSTLEAVTPVKRVGPHAKVADIFQPNGALERKEYFVFTFVRNPWDRLVSTFFYIMSGGRAPIDKRRRDTILSKYRGDFKSFVLDIENWIDIQEEDSIYPDKYIPHFRPQYEYIYDKQGQCVADFIGRFENIDNDFKRLCDVLSLDSVFLKKTNKSKHKKYYKYYDDESQAIVAEYFARDIALFDYQFEREKSGLSKLISNVKGSLWNKG